MLKTTIASSKTLVILFLVITFSVLQAQVSGTQKKYIRIGSLQSHFSAYGAERAWTGGTNPYYEGLIWPADYPFQDNAVIKRTWLAFDDFVDENGKAWDKYGLYFSADYVDQSMFPVELSQKTKFELPKVYVDGNDVNSIYTDEYDEVVPDLKADRIVTNVVNTTSGLTMSRTIYAFSQQYHDNYFIKEYVFTNTGNTDYDDTIELHRTLNGVYFSWGTRYSASREGAGFIGDGQVYGKHLVVTKRGETYASNHQNTITESTPIQSLDWIRAVFGWSGQASPNSFDNIGAPDINGNGRLGSPQHIGVASLYIDESTSLTDHLDQPSVMGWHAGDTYPGLGDMQNIIPMRQLYTMLSGNPHLGEKYGGTNRFDESYITSLTYQADPWEIHGDGGGTNLWVVYGPFDIPEGESIRIVEAEGVNGLSRLMCEKVGKRWKQAYLNSGDEGPFDLPDNTTSKDEDVYKNSWVATGKDSIMLTFSRAKRNFDSGMNIPPPPQPPGIFSVQSGGDKILLSWDPSISESNANFAGYKIYRGVGKADTTYDEIFACGENTDNPELVYSYEDKSPIRGFSYYYYLVSYTDGSENTSGEFNPAGSLHSGRFFTQTTQPAFLTRPPGENLNGIRIVPNPFNIKARNYNYPGEENKITFLNIPAYCRVKVFTERGDLIHTIEHDNGSGDESWNLITSSRQMIASGLYLAYFEVTQDYINEETGKLYYKKGDNIVKKFVVIR